MLRLAVSGAVRPIYGSLGFKRLTSNGKCIPWQWTAYFMEIIAGLLSRAVVEGGMNTSDSVNTDHSDGTKMER